LSATAHVNDVTIAPIFVNYQSDGSGDYHLQQGSSSIDPGIASLGGQPAPVANFDGVPGPVLLAISVPANGVRSEGY
jgi:hypothetical protein